ncbi:MAG: methyl-accepting chemotaxis protein [Marinobacter sp.]
MITVLALGGSIALFIVFLRMIILPISTFKEQLDNIAKGEGDLTQRVPVELDDDLGALARSFNQVLEDLQQMIAAIQTLSVELGKGADELRQASKDNSESTDQQTGAISIVATAINEMQSAIEEVAGNASRAAEVTREADQKGHNSSEIIRKSSVQVHRLAAQIETAVKVIRALSDNSDKITSVLDVIRSVAEQTNLLALNAAIEAARAGEQGRGFAVVADEVRTLAQRTQKSTADIQAMIGTLQKGVADIVSVMETGSQEASEAVALATEAEQELNAVLEAITRITDMNMSVASATEQQTQVVDEINRSITDINDLAYASAARSEEINATSHALDGYACELEKQAGRQVPSISVEPEYTHSNSGIPEWNSFRNHRMLLDSNRRPFFLSPKRTTMKPNLKACGQAMMTALVNAVLALVLMLLVEFAISGSFSVPAAYLWAGLVIWLFIFFGQFWRMRYLCQRSEPRRKEA